jgi:hypothetical protein
VQGRPKPSASKKKKKKTRTVKPEDAFEITAFGRWFKNAKGREEAALHLLGKQGPPIDS